MLDFRIKKPQSALNWRYQEIIIDEEYLANNPDPLLIELDYPYEMGIKALDVYYNGQRLTEGVSGAGFVEVDATHIRLDLGTYPDGTPILPQVGDMIVIKEWFNSSSILYGQQGFNARLSRLEQEVMEARGTYPKLNDRLVNLDLLLGFLMGEGNFVINYIYDENEEDVVREEITGDVSLTIERRFNSDGRPVEETVYHGDKQITRTFEYDPQTGRLVKVTTTTVNV